ncbi:MAG: DNA polymerase domain-containing protein, partial [Candidatus Ranarchaeia archaeon]
MSEEGWLLDAVIDRKTNTMKLWLKTTDHRTIPFTVPFRPQFYVWCSKESPWGPLKRLARAIREHQGVFQVEEVEKYRRLEDAKTTPVLAVTTTGVNAFKRTVHDIGALGDLDIYNADLPLEQLFFLDSSLFPFCYTTLSKDNHNEIIAQVRDHQEDIDYALPPLNVFQLTVNNHKAKALPDRLQLGDPLKSITLTPVERWLPHSTGEKDPIVIDGPEDRILPDLAATLKEQNVDVIITVDGDDTIFPYLAGKAAGLEQTHELVLGREPKALYMSVKRKPSSYFSYGQIFYRSNRHTTLSGRLHVDTRQSSPIGFVGGIEISRLTKCPLQRSTRITIGQNFTNIQLAIAFKKGVLIPPVKRNTEYFKNGMELLTADKGGLIFTPKIGVFGQVAEFDFTSLYPSLMYGKNISPETVECTCCPNSNILVPQIGFRTCQQRQGLIPETLELLLKKRRIYKRYKKTNFAYDQRQAAIKWILVTCFGYLGFKNARFGRVEAHMATTAWAREVLLRTAELAERQKFEILHGIVDCLWLKRQNATLDEFKAFGEEVTREIGIEFDFDGLFRWIVFLPSRIHENVSVMNRFYGAFESGKVKARGLAVRRRDTPWFLKTAQNNMLKVLAQAKTVDEFYEIIPEVQEVLEEHRERLRSNVVEIRDLVFKRRLTRDPSDYKVPSPQAICAKQL